MTEPGFRVEGLRQTAHFLPRATFPDYYRFEDARCAVLIEPKAAQAMRAAAERARPRETGGLLSGRALRDDHGSYVVVSGFIEAEQAAGQVAAFHITTKQLGVLRTLAARANPGADEVGWWHSHTAPSQYSQTDHNTQRMFERDDSVGLLVFASGKYLAAAYVGPNAQALGFSVSPKGHQAESDRAVGPAQRASVPVGSGDRAAQPDDSARYPGPAGAGPGPEPGFRITSSPARRLWPSGQALLITVLVAVVVAIVIMLVALLVNSGDTPAQFSSLQQSLSGQINHLANADNNNYKQLSGQVAGAHDAPATTPSATSSSATGAPSAVTGAVVAWSCSRTSPGDYTCSAASAPNATSGWKVEWAVGTNHNVGTGGRNQVPLVVSKTEQVDAILVSPTGGKYWGVAQTLSP